MEVKNVIEVIQSSIYQRNHLVLSDVNIALSEGEFVYLIGKTGSGKSSLLKVLYGDLPLKTGTGKVVGIDLKSLKTSKIPDLRRHLGIVFQDFQLLTDRTVEQNLIFVLKATGWKDKKSIETRIDEVLDSVGMLSKKKMMPFRLSGGEQQRVSIARALLNHPELILADEPTGNLDPETSNEIMNLLLSVSKQNNCAVLMATHDYDIIRRYPARMIRCEEGRVLDVNADSIEF
ncbi:cell division ATP-binding protein FtsE [Faecalibacter rhinopitheci]|uniref:Cell division ATP-binding protein FtsE n=1 Tax=Faecalibacter rhinopitheci TaxID=2779678 RepID=A0A8J7K3V4_9FLAO|nr:ATP-binding cassette domain-containing protein [Faecalibacter rhinopitheci]MBF0596629.1 ATP-binding cassette domain-containing protein [Faecalibacter rhinopitheci]MBQ0147474.1 ATP-binding cassette domain-containing protein [Candidatus Onthonaster equi]